MTDLYKIYRIISQRNKRNPGPHYQAMSDLSKSIIFDKLFAGEIISIAKKILDLEKLSAERVYQGAKIIRAVEQKDYEIKIPCMRSDSGNIYILTSEDLPGQTKISATTMDVSSRIFTPLCVPSVNFDKRYDISVKLYYTKYVDNVFQLEEKLHHKFQSKRVNQNFKIAWPYKFRVMSCGGSIEWFYIKPDDAVDLILELLSEQEG